MHIRVIHIAAMRRAYGSLSNFLGIIGYITFVLVQAQAQKPRHCSQLSVLRLLGHEEVVIAVNRLRQLNHE